MAPSLQLKEKKASQVVNTGMLNSHKTFALLFSEQINGDLHLPSCLKNTLVHLVKVIFMAECIYTDICHFYPHYFKGGQALSTESISSLWWAARNSP